MLYIFEISSTSQTNEVQYLCKIILHAALFPPDKVKIFKNSDSSLWFRSCSLTPLKWMHFLNWTKKENVMKIKHKQSLILK